MRGPDFTLAGGARDFEIGKSKYRIAKLPLRQSRPVMLRLMKALSACLDASQINLSKPNIGLVATLVRVALDELKDSDMQLIEEAFELGTKLHQPIKFSNQKEQEHFAAFDLDDLSPVGYFQWLRACVEVNYSDFLDVAASGQSILSKLSEMMRAPQSNSTTQQSTEDFGDSSQVDKSTSP